MKKILPILAAALVPALIFLNVWQSFRYTRVREEIARLEALQKEWREANRRLIAGIAVYESPGRINALAEEELELEKAEPEDVEVIQLPRTGESQP